MRSYLILLSTFSPEFSGGIGTGFGEERFREIDLTLTN